MTSDQIRICPKCGAEIRAPSIKYCPICNTPLETPPPQFKPPTPVEPKILTWKTSLKALILGFLLLLVAINSCAYILIVLYGPLVLDLPDLAILSVISATKAVLLIPVAWYINKKEELGVSYEDSRSLLSDILIGIVWAGILIAVVWVIYTVEDTLLPPYPLYEFVETVFKTAKPEDYALFLVSTGLITPISEEFFARVLIQQGLENSSGKRKGLLLSSLLVTLMFIIFSYTYALWLFLPMFIENLLLGLLYQLRNRRILPCICSHVLYQVIPLFI
ncbi:MAG: CPBP family glutamic-type intramembrane protease [Candidatus Baldrarchaeia archaeon]